MATQVSGADGWLTINGRALSFQPESENEALHIHEYSRNTIEITPAAPDHLAIWIDDLRLESARYGIWNWNPEHYAGLYRLTVEMQNHRRYTAYVRVFPHKLTQQRYEKMKAELSATAIDLLFSLLSPATERAVYTSRMQETSPLHDYRQIRGVIDQMHDVMAHIRRDPYRALHQESMRQDWQEIACFSDAVAPVPRELVHLPEQPTRRQNVRYLPRYWTVQQSSPTYDTYENRLLKQFLQKQLIAKLTFIQERAEHEKRQVEQQYARYHNDEDGETIRRLQHSIAECQRMKHLCIVWSNEAFLKNVQPLALANKATQVLLKHPTYSRFYHLYLQFQQRLKTSVDAERYVSELALRRVSALYEMWSVFAISRMAVEVLLAEGYRLISNTTFYEVETDYFQFDVRKNVSSIVLAKDELRVRFIYEPVYPSQSTVTSRSALVSTTMERGQLKPDMAIEVYERDTPQHVLIFDAKYRWSRSYDGIFYPNQEDIDKMYRYRNNIQYRQYHNGRARNPYTTQPIVTSSYILYPGNQIHTEGDKTIGALPLIPDLSPRRLDDIREQLKDLLYYAYLID
jgi:hypothetical protein